MNNGKSLNLKLLVLQNKAIKLKYFEHEIPSKIDQEISNILKDIKISTEKIELKNGTCKV